MVRGLAVLALVAIGLVGSACTRPVAAQCPEGSVAGPQANTCVWTQLTCAPGSQWDGEHCVRTDAAVCPAGTRLEGDHCQAEVDYTCPAGTEFEDERGCVATVVQPPPRRSPTDEEVDCILDPRTCNTPRDPSRPPRRLSTTDVKNGMNAIMPAARRCGSTHGASPGTKVTVKIMVAGDTGRVVSAKPSREHQGTVLGECVAEAAQQAKFPVFDDSRMGFSFSFRM